MNRRDFFPAVVAGAVSASLPVAAAPIKRSGMKLLAKFDEPVTAMTAFKGMLFVASGNKVHAFDVNGEPFDL